MKFALYSLIETKTQRYTDAGFCQYFMNEGYTAISSGEGIKAFENSVA